VQVAVPLLSFVIQNQTESSQPPEQLIAFNIALRTHGVARGDAGEVGGDRTGDVRDGGRRAVPPSPTHRADRARCTAALGQLKVGFRLGADIQDSRSSVSSREACRSSFAEATRCFT
jgi:hypothetical protein